MTEPFVVYDTKTHELAIEFLPSAIKIIVNGRKIYNTCTKLSRITHCRQQIQTIVNEIQHEGGQVVYRVTDVTSAQCMQELAIVSIDQYGRIDVLINNAGIMPNSPLHELKIEEWNQMIDVDIKGVLYGIAAVLPTMKEQNSGQILNISSLMGH